MIGDQGRTGKNQRPADTEMREQHLSQFGEDLFLSSVCRQHNILQCQSGQLAAPHLLRFQRNQSRMQLGYRMSDALRKPQSVPCTSR